MIVAPTPLRLPLGKNRPTTDYIEIHEKIKLNLSIDFSYCRHYGFKMNKTYPSLDKRYAKIKEQERLLEAGKVLVAYPVPTYRKICTVCQKNTQVSNKKCGTCV